MAIDKFPYIFKKFVKSPIALMTRNQISTWPMWKSDFHMTHGEIVAHFTENWSCGNQISVWAMWKSDFWSLVQLVISRKFLKMNGNLSMAKAYTNSYRNKYFYHCPLYLWLKILHLNRRCL